MRDPSIAKNAPSRVPAQAGIFLGFVKPWIVIVPGLVYLIIL
jgi:hypothetical protein